jgi:branched-chain amino acid transport system permease protein
MPDRGVLALIFMTVLVGTVPLFAGDFWVSLTIKILVLGLLALSVDLLLGHAGLLSLCHAAFFAMSAYTVAILQVRYGVSMVAAVPAGIAMGTLLALVFGVAVRTRGVYFILVTIALGFIVWGVTYRWASFTGGDNGITNVPYPAIGEWQITSMTAYFYVVLVIVLGCVLAYRTLIMSPFGLVLRGLKSSESRMRSLGYSPLRHLYVAFVLSGFMASIAGVLYIYFNRFVNPSTAHFHISVEAVLMAILGGTGTIVGAFLGSFVIMVLRNWVSGFFPYYMTIMGLVFILTVLFAPHGIIGLINSWRTRRARRKDMPLAAPQQPETQPGSQS